MHLTRIPKARATGARWAWRWEDALLAAVAVALLLAPGAPGAERPASEAAAEETLTFLVTSDAHYDAFENEDRNVRNRQTIDEMNRIEKESWPEALGGGPIGKPRGVLALGDLIDDGDRMLEGKHQTPEQWARYVADFGLDGTDGVLRYPVYEGTGNHDGPPAGRERFGFSFQAKLKARNGLRKEKGLIDHLSPSGLHYSWDWGRVHLVQLNLYPGNRPHPKTRYSPAYHDPQGSLDFLVEDLKAHVGESGRPVVIAHHYDLQGTDWWHEEERRAYYDAIAGYNVIAIFHGHTGTGTYTWKPAAREATGEPKGGEGTESTEGAEGTKNEERGARALDVVNTGQTERGFFVVEISPRRFRTAYRVKTEPGPEGNGSWGWAHLLDRPIAERATSPIRTAKVAQGKLDGVIEDGVASFKGIPFAAPPFGGLRWKAPEPPKPWTGVNAAEGGRRAEGERRASGRRTQRDRMEEVRVASPNGGVCFIVLANADRLTFTVTMGATAVIEPSALSVLIDGLDLAGSGLIQGEVQRYEIDERYPWHGVHAEAVNRCRGARLAITSDLMMTVYTLEIRAFDDGVGYRIIVPGSKEEARTADERSTFVLPEGSVVWYHDLDGHYEAEYERRDVSSVKAGQWAGPPVTFELPQGGGYGAIAEANLVDYAGMALECDGRRGWTIGLGHRQPISYPYELRYGREEAKRLARPAAISGTITTPWRVVLVATDLNGLVNCDVISSLCPPADPALFPQGIKTPWVEPGLCVWDYVDRGYVAWPEIDRIDGRAEREIARMRRFSELAGQIGARYHILEGFAYGWSDDQVADFVEFSHRQGVRVILWRHSKELRTPEAREDFFSRLERLGVAGAKIDFIDHEAKESVDLYVDLLRAAAVHRCVIDFHGANKPTGLLRTWPNEMLKEAVRGMESSGLRERARHECILPFTRYLAGPADYTTMIFTERRRDSTWAHQIACLATFQSPILTIAAHPQSILDNPALEVIKSIVAVWDETLVLPPSKIGEMSVFARRSGEMWILAVMRAGPGTGIRVPLSFLGAGDYRATYVRDDPERDGAVKLESGRATRDDTLEIELSGGGGFVGRFIK